MPVPRQKAPELIVETLEHGRFDLTTERPGRLTLVCFYRGLHCPVCANYLKELERLTPGFAEYGVGTIAIRPNFGEMLQAADYISGTTIRREANTPVPCKPNPSSSATAQQSKQRAGCSDHSGMPLASRRTWSAPEGYRNLYYIQTLEMKRHGVRENRPG